MEDLKTMSIGSNRIATKEEPWNFHVDLIDIMHPYTNDPVPNFSGIMRTDTQEVLAINSDIYHVVQNYDVVENYRNAFAELDINFTEKIEMYHKNRKMHARFRLDDDRFKFDIGGVGDIVGFSIDGWNSVDKSSSLKTSASAERLVCLNGMVSFQEFSSEAVRHVDTNDDRHNAILNNVKATVEGITKTVEIWNKMKQTKVDIDTVKAMVEHFKKTRKTISAKIEMLWENPDLKMGREESHSYWDLLNCVTEAVTHDLKRIEPAKMAFIGKAQEKLYRFLKAA